MSELLNEIVKNITHKMGTVGFWLISLLLEFIPYVYKMVQELLGILDENLRKAFFISEQLLALVLLCYLIAAFIIICFKKPIGQKMILRYNNIILYPGIMWLQLLIFPYIIQQYYTNHGITSFSDLPIVFLISMEVILTFFIIKDINKS
ncbi:hypothetical protein [Limosilactobacillus walteri]|uniref:DUF2975 domain-containing protein n=1 Tax=Limosilactobacillus walteri TaxID=2268022 RepID=A0ABR8P797_9LACO|nr:hypothetical protein [Limosilactobacillus walteri]MBD5806557.1 hypothetical protein [Limosilactobacillus walteri]